MKLLPVGLAGMLFIAAFSCGDSDSTPAPKISGLMIYSTDEFGNPNVFDPVTNTFYPAILWRTQVGGFGYGLGILRGLPPDSLSGPLLNAQDFSVQIALMDGTNDFTIVGEPFPLTRGTFQRLALDVYFDGVLGHPGTSILFPPNANPAGSAPVANASDFVFDLSLDRVTATPQSFYTHATQLVSVVSVSFLPNGGGRWDVDLVSAYAPVSDGLRDWVGILRINVGTTAATAPLGG